MIVGCICIRAFSSAPERNSEPRQKAHSDKSALWGSPRTTNLLLPTSCVISADFWCCQPAVPITSAPRPAAAAATANRCCPACPLLPPCPPPPHFRLTTLVHNIASDKYWRLEPLVSTWWGWGGAPPRRRPTATLPPTRRRPARHMPAPPSLLCCHCQPHSHTTAPCHKGQGGWHGCPAPGGGWGGAPPRHRPLAFPPTCRHPAWRLLTSSQMLPLILPLKHQTL